MRGSSLRQQLLQLLTEDWMRRIDRSKEDPETGSMDRVLKDCATNLSINS